jgi:hypothetical protein
MVTDGSGVAVGVGVKTTVSPAGWPVAVAATRVALWLTSDIRCPSGVSGARVHHSAMRPPMTENRMISAQGMANRRRFGVSCSEDPQEKQVDAL